MRVTVKFSSFGGTLDEIVDRACDTWGKFTDLELPHNTEFLVEETADYYTAQITAQVKIETGS